MKKICCFFIRFCMLALPFTGFAADNTDKADALAALGLFQGTGEGYDLDSPLTRAQSATMLVRLLGAEDEALSAPLYSVFSDVPREHWAAKHVMYCYENNITKGTSEDTFTPERPVSAEEFTVLTLRLLEYEAEPDTAFETAVDCGLFGTEVSRNLAAKEEFLRNDMVYIAFRALKTKCADGKALSQKLIDEGVITREDAEKQGVLDALEADDIDGVIDGLFS